MLYLNVYLKVRMPALAHVDCIIQKLNELLDSDWEPGRQPEKLVGFGKEGEVKRPK